MKKMLLHVIIGLSLLVADTGFSQAIEWSKCFGGSSTDDIYSAIETKDNGYIFCGYTKSSDGDLQHIPLHTNVGWFAKVDAFRSRQWQSFIDSCWLTKVFQTKDGGYLIQALDVSVNHKLGSHGGMDGWLQKYSSEGVPQWQRFYGGSGYDIISTWTELPDSSILVTAGTNSIDGDLAPLQLEQGSYNWLFTIAPDGTIKWQKVISSSGVGFSTVIPTSDNNFIGVGTITKTDESNPGFGNSDVWVIKMDRSGNTIWQKRFGGSAADGGGNILETSDKGFVIAGSTKSEDGQVIGYHGHPADQLAWSDLWVIKIDSAGKLEWQKTIGGTGEDSYLGINNNCVPMVLNQDKSIVIGISGGSADGDFFDNHGAYDFSLVKLSSAGQLIWERSYGGGGWDNLESLIKTHDNNYLIGGRTSSSDGDIEGYKGGFPISDTLGDGWLAKIKDPANVNSVASLSRDSYSVSPNPATDKLSIRIPNAEGRQHLTLASLLGVQVLHKEIQGHGAQIMDVDMDIHDIPNGTYILNIESTAGISAHTVLISR